MLACAAALYRMPSASGAGRNSCNQNQGAARGDTSTDVHPAIQAAVKQLDLFGRQAAKHPTPEFEWQQLPEETRQMVTGLMVHLLVNHQRRDREPSSTVKAR